MINPFRKKMPIGLDIKIRLRIFRAYLSSRRPTLSAFGAGLLVPVIATYVFIINPNQTQSPIDTEAVVSAIYDAQASEIAKAETGIYHIKRTIKEGGDKPSFVALASDGSTPEVTERVDEVETWQHNDTALALIESNGTDRSFEAYLSREHNGELGLHHYGPVDQERENDRVAYDDAHDLASLYTNFTSLDRPAVPVLPDNAELMEITEDTASFAYVPAEGLEIVAIVDLSTNLVVEEIIYMIGDDNRYEMTTITYAERLVIPAEQFDSIFDPNQFAYDQIS